MYIYKYIFVYLYTYVYICISIHIYICMYRPKVKEVKKWQDVFWEYLLGSIHNRHWLNMIPIISVFLPEFNRSMESWLPLR